MKLHQVFILVSALLSSALYAQDTWKRKADTGGEPRSAGVGFSIGSKGYAGFGNSFLRDFWEYDPVTDRWSRKADIPGKGRFCTVGFSIGNKGYVGTGAGSSGNLNDFWEFDPSTGKWTEKASLPAPRRQYAVGFSIGNKGYIGTGTETIGIYYKDLWEYDPATDKWTKKADFAGEARRGGIGFSLNGKGYIGLGYGKGLYNDMWEYDPAADTWTRKADFPGDLTLSPVCFTINDKAYVGTGMAGPGSLPVSKNFWEYDPATDTWMPISDYPGNGGCQNIAFSVSDTGYVGQGRDKRVDYHSDFWAWTTNQPPKPKADTATAVVEKKEPHVDPINNRPVTIQNTITADTVSFDIYVWDDKKYDRDSISLNFNGEWVLKDHLLTKEKTKISLQLRPGSNNYLVLYALNEGNIPPNTVAISYYDRNKEKMIILNSDLGSCGAVNILYQNK